jgi:hypothetical protein
MSTKHEDEELTGWDAWALAGTEGFEGEEEQAEEAQDPPIDETEASDGEDKSEFEKRFAELAAQAKAEQPAQAKADVQPAFPAMDLAKIEALKEDFPELYATFVAQHETIAKMGETLKTLSARELERQEERQGLIRQTIQAEIEKIPALAHLQKADPTRFKQAVELDNLLSASEPKLSIPERFAKVAAAMEAIHGQSAKQADTTKSQPKPTKTAPRKPISLSDLPSGDPVLPEGRALENATFGDLYSSWWGKTEAELEKIWRDSAKA